MIINKLSVAIIIVNKFNEVLLGRRTDNNTWSLPGGKLELNETYAEAAKRELFEEVGLFMNTFEELGFNTVHFAKGQFWQSMVYLCDNFYGINEENDEWGIKLEQKEMKEYKWFKIDDIKEMMKTNLLFDGSKSTFEAYLNRVEKERSEF